MGRRKATRSQFTSKTRKLEPRIKFGNYHLDLGKHPENVYRVHLCLDSNNLFGYCICYLSIRLDTWTDFVNAVIPKVKFPRYDLVIIFRSSGLFLAT